MELRNTVKGLGKDREKRKDPFKIHLERVKSKILGVPIKGIDPDRIRNKTIEKQIEIYREKIEKLNDWKRKYEGIIDELEDRRKGI